MEEWQAEELMEEHLQNSQIILDCIQQNDPMLNSLYIGSLDGGFVSTDGTTISKLGDSIGENTNLERLFYYNDLVAISSDIESRTLRLASEVMASNETFFDGLKRNGSIAVVGLHRCSLTKGAVGNRMLKAFQENNRNLTHVSLHGCRLGSEEIDLLTLTLKRCTNVQEVSLTGSVIRDDLLESAVAALRGLRKLKKLRLRYDGVRSARPLASLIQDPACNLVNLDLGGRFIIGDGCAEVLASALRNNTTLESINLPCHPCHGVMSGRGWDAIFGAMCDTTNINATYLSNHTLKFVGGRVPPINQLKVSFRLNSSSLNKKQVAIKKILLHHCHFDMKSFFQWDLKALPAVVAWFGRARDCVGSDEEQSIDVRQVDAIYQFIRALPEFIELAPRWGEGEIEQNEAGGM